MSNQVRLQQPEYFNPLPRKEGDLDSGSYVGKGTISIHSLVKRETVSNQVRLQQPEYFNPLPRKEGDQTSQVTCLI